MDEILRNPPKVGDRIVSYGIENTTNISTIDDLLNKIDKYEKSDKTEYGVGLLQNDLYGGSYRIVAHEEAKRKTTGSSERYVRFWSKSYFVDLRQKLLQKGW